MATVTITKSEEMERKLPSSLQARNFVLPNGVDLNKFSPRSQDEARRELGWSPTDKVILFLGNPDDPRKNVTLAHAATEIVSQQVSDTRLHVAWGVSPDRVPTLMNAANCLLFASRSEGSPNAIKEAMACELPVVATPVGDISERLAGIENCYVREPSPQSFAEALIQAIKSGRAPQARVAIESLSIGSIANRLLSIYDTVADIDGMGRASS